MPDVHDTHSRPAGTLGSEAARRAVRHPVPVQLPDRSAACADARAADVDIAALRADIDALHGTGG